MKATMIAVAMLTHTCRNISRSSSDSSTPNSKKNKHTLDYDQQARGLRITNKAHFIICRALGYGIDKSGAGAGKE